MITLLADVGLLAAGGLEWTPITFYILAGVIHFVLILVGFRLLGVDPEQNGVIGAVIAAVLINVVQYFLRDTGVVGAIIVGVGSFAVLAGITSGEVLKAFFMTVIVIASYGGIGKVVLPRTPLEADDVGGFTRTVLTGGLEAEPITEREANKLSEGVDDEEQ